MWKNIRLNPNIIKKHNAKLDLTGLTKGRYVYNQETLGFRLDSAKEIAVFRDQAEPDHIKIDNLFDYGWNLVKTIMNIQATMHLHSDDWHRTIYIDTLGVSTTDFGLKEQLKKKLIDSGRKCTEKYFEWYDKEDLKPEDKPKNRPE